MYIQSIDDMLTYGEGIGRSLKGGEVIELQGDIGAGKTTFVRGLARGLDVDEDIASPTFTISRAYSARDGLTLMHYDFYRLHEAGIMAEDIHEAVHDPTIITVVEWGGTVEEVLPVDRMRLQIIATGENEREVTKL